MPIGTTERQRLRVRRGTKAQVVVVPDGMLGEPYLATDIMALYIHNGSLATPVAGRLPFRTITSSDTATAQDVVILADATGGAVTITLPSAVSNPGMLLAAKKIDASANAMILAGAGGQTIDGEATAAVVNPYDALNVFSNGVNWYIIL